MKKLVAMASAILFAAGISSFAAGTSDETRPAKQCAYQLSFNKIQVADDIELVLEESTNRVIDIMGNEGDIEKVDWKIKGNVLYVKSRKGSLKDKVKVTVSVNQLREIVIDGDSKVTSLNQLSSPNLDVFIAADSYVSIRNSGRIHVKNAIGTELEVRKMVGEVIVGR